MTEPLKSKLYLEFQSAKSANNPPDIKGSYRVAEDGAPSIDVALWSGVSDKGTTYASGEITLPTVSANVEAKAAAAIEMPSGVNFKKVGDAVLFKDTHYTGKNGEPHWYGYAHEGKRIVRLDAYEHGTALIGSVHPWHPKQKKNAPQSDAPDVK